MNNEITKSVIVSDGLDSRLLEKFKAIKRKEEEIVTAGITELGTLICRARKAAGMSQAKLAQLACVPQGNLSKIELGRGRTGPTFSTIIRLCTALGIRVRFEMIS